MGIDEGKGLKVGIDEGKGLKVGIGVEGGNR